jgi:thioredoxin 1
MRTVTDASFGSEVLQSARPVLVDFWAEWCGPCLKVVPVLEELATELADRVDIVKVDIDANPKVTDAYEVRSVPTLTVFKDGRRIDQLVGAWPKGDVIRLIESALKTV